MPTVGEQLDMDSMFFSHWEDGRLYAYGNGHAYTIDSRFNILDYSPIPFDFAHQLSYTTGCYSDGQYFYGYYNKFVYKFRKHQLIAKFEIPFDVLPLTQDQQGVLYNPLYVGKGRILLIKTPSEWFELKENGFVPVPFDGLPQPDQCVLDYQPDCYAIWQFGPSRAMVVGYFPQDQSYVLADYIPIRKLSASQSTRECEAVVVQPLFYSDFFVLADDCRLLDLLLGRQYEVSADDVRFFKFYSLAVQKKLCFQQKFLADCGVDIAKRDLVLQRVLGSLDLEL